MAPRTERFDGVLVSWRTDKGYGFIEPSVGGRQVFVHIRALQGETVPPEIGEAVSYEVEVTPDGKRRATHVQWAMPEVATAPAGVHGGPPNRVRRRILNSRSSVVDYLVIIAFAVLYGVVDLVWALPIWVAGIYLVASVLCILVYAVDKSAAIEGRWRVSESALLALGLVGGWPGAIVAQRILRHKTKKVRFRIAFWGSVLLNIAAFVAFSSFYYEHVLLPGR